MAFDFQAYRNPYVSTIADLLSRGEDAKAKALVDVANAQARAAEVRGQAYGGAIENVGKIVSGIPAQIQAGKDQAFKTAQQARLVQQQKLEDAAQARQDLARVKFSEFQANPNVTTVTPGQAGSLPDRMSPSLAPKTFVPDAQMPVGGTIGGFLNRANVFGGSLSNALPQDVPDARADMIPSVSMSGNAAPAPRLTPTMSVPETTNVTNTSKRMSVGDVNGLDLWDINAYAKQMAAAGLSAEAQPSLELMRASNDDMEKHHASALAVARNDAARILKFADSQIPSAVDQLVEKYSNNGVFPTQQLEMVKQQIVAIKQLPQDQQLLAYKKLVQAVGDVEQKIVTNAPGSVSTDITTNEVVSSGGPVAVTLPQSTAKRVRITLPDGTTTEITADYVPGRGKSGKYFVEDKDISSLNPQLIEQSGNTTMVDLALRQAGGNVGDALKILQPPLQVTDEFGNIKYVAKSDAVGGPEIKWTPAQQTRIAALDKAIADIDAILEMADDPNIWPDAKKGVGAFGVGPVKSAAKDYLNIGSDTQATFRNRVNALRASTAFGEGGKSLTKTEKEMMAPFNASIGINPDVGILRLRDMRKRLASGRSVMGVGQQPAVVPIQKQGESSDADADAAIARANAARVARERK